MRRFFLAAFVCAIGACGGTGGGAGGGDTDPTVPTRGRTAASAYRHHHPRVLSHGAWNELTAVVLAPDGMLTRTFRANTRTWTDWSVWGLPGGASTPPDPDSLGGHVPVVPLRVRGAPAFGGVFRYGAGRTVRQALPYVRNPSSPSAFTWHNADSPVAPGPAIGQPAQDFHAAAIVGDPQGFVAFGTGRGRASPNQLSESPLVRVAANIGAAGTVAANFADLGEPTVTVGGATLPGRVAVGPSAAVDVPVVTGATTTLHTFVVVKAVPAGDEDRVACWHAARGAPAGSGVWTDLGLPSGTQGRLYGAPLALLGARPATGRARVHVFITAFDRGRSRYTLFEKQWDDTGGDVQAGWSQWMPRGKPPNLRGNQAFVLTTHAAWSTQGGIPARITLFGVADVNPPRLVEYSMVGTTWNFGPAHPLPPDGQGVNTSSMAALSFGAYRRVSVMCRAQDGAVWEYAFETGGATTTTGWSWVELP